jgi:hypothetical protein
LPFVFVTSLSAVALAQPSPSDIESARTAYTQGLELRDKRNDLPGALAKFKAAYALIPTPRIGFEIGRTLRAMGDLVGARTAFLAAVALPPRPNESAEAKKARGDSDAQATDLEARIPQLILHIVGTGQIYVDGEAIRHDALAAPRRVNPGSHVVQLQVDGDVKAEQTVTVREGDHQDVTMSPGVQARITVMANTAPSAPPPVVVTDPTSPYGTYQTFTPLVHSGSSTKAGLAYAALTLGGIGVIPGVVALGFMKSAQDNCVDGLCSSSFSQNKTLAYGFAIATDVIWGAAIICAIAAIAIPSSNVSMGLAPLPNGGYFSATGRF